LGFSSDMIDYPNRRICFSAAVLLFSLISHLPAHTQDLALHTESTNRQVTVADVIEMRKLADRFAASSGQIAQFSPDGKQFVVVLRKGNLERRSNDYSILLWKCKGIFESPRPRVLLTMASSSNRAAISEVAWLSDSETIVFLGERPAQSHQLYSFNTRTRVLKRLTNHPTNLIWYSVTPRGDKVAYVAEEPADVSFQRHISEREWVISAFDNAWSLFEAGKGGESGDPQLFFLTIGGRTKRITTEGGVPGCCLKMISLSPDGRHIAMALNAKLEESWTEYTDWLVRDATKQKISGSGSGLRTYMLIDTRTGRSRVLLDVPVNSEAWQVAWSPDSSAIAIGGTYLPLKGTSGEERTKRRSKTFTVEISIPNGAVSTVTEDDLRLVAWNPATNALIFEPKTWLSAEGPPPKVIFRKKLGNWQRLPPQASGDRSVDVVLKQDMNNPPKIYAMSPQQHDLVALLLDLNPQFARLAFGKVEEIRWRGTDGNDALGGLYYPPHYIPGKRLPLVIQTHGWDRNVFAIDGPYSTAFAAQPLAGKGIMVLQTAASYKDFDTPKEVEDNEAMFEGAIDYLDKKGLIDRRRIGIIGWSRTCLHLKYALTHSTYHFAAASVTEGFDAGYLQYLLCLPSGCGSFTQAVEDINAGTPFGSGLKSWLERSPGANINKVDTPLHIQALSRISTLGDWQWFAIMSRLRKPVELSVLDGGTHLLEKPWQRMISLQSNVDWFTYWLKNEEDPDPKKSEQYARWRKLRLLQH
jgi:dipeptidyl aminopeptidase/acylaminoacyl peptidase